MYRLGSPLLRAAALASLLHGAAGEVSDAAAIIPWDYGNQTKWARIPGTMCGHTDDQSPIDMRSTKLRSYPLQVLRDGRSVRMGPATWSYDWALVNTSLGWSASGAWEVRLLPAFAQTTRMTFLDRDFSLQSFHFTSPSENRIEGEGFDMEVQHVLRSRDEKVLVISVMLRVGLVPDNPYMAQFWADFPAYSPRGAAVDKVIANPFYGAFPKDRSFFVFKGSLTHPPCTNEVTWVVFQEPVLISRSQRDTFREALNMSSRPGFLRYAPGQIPPKGVIEPWDTSLGLNNRHLSPQGIRQVVKVSVEADKARASSPMLPANSWAYVVLGLLAGALLLGIVALAIVARHHGKQRVTRGRVLAEDGMLPDGSLESARRRLRRKSRQAGESSHTSRSLVSSDRSARSSARSPSPSREEDLRFARGLEDEQSGAGSPMLGEVEMQLLQDKSAPLPSLSSPWPFGPPPDLRAALLPAEKLAQAATRATSQPPLVPAGLVVPGVRPAPGPAAPVRPLALAPGSTLPGTLRAPAVGQQWPPPPPLAGPAMGLRR